MTIEAIAMLEAQLDRLEAENRELRRQIREMAVDNRRDADNSRASTRNRER